MRLVTLTAFLLLITGMAFAADIDGKWEGEVQGMDGSPMKINYTFKADGAKLTGNTKGMEGNDISIENVKIDGNKFSFSLDFGMGMPMNFKGTLTGDKIEMTMDMGDMGGGGMGEMPPTILKRVK